MADGVHRRGPASPARPTDGKQWLRSLSIGVAGVIPDSTEVRIMDSQLSRRELLASGGLLLAAPRVAGVGGEADARGEVVVPGGAEAPPVEEGVLVVVAPVPLVDIRVGRPALEGVEAKLAAGLGVSSFVSR